MQVLGRISAREPGGRRVRLRHGVQGRRDRQINSRADRAGSHCPSQTISKSLARSFYAPPLSPSPRGDCPVVMLACPLLQTFLGTTLATTSLLIIVGAVMQTSRQVESLLEGPRLQEKLQGEQTLIQSLRVL